MIAEYWAANYPACPPIAYRLRGEFPARWVRFHSLPASKRYAENEAEYQTILQRHNKILQYLALPSEELAIVSVGYSEDQAPTRDEQLDALDPNASCWQTIADPDGESEVPTYWHFFHSNWQWSPGVFDKLLRRVADGQIANIMILSTQSLWVFHPYDGGADVVLSSSAARDELKAKFGAWLSPHPSGM